MGPRGGGFEEWQGQCWRTAYGEMASRASLEVYAALGEAMSDSSFRLCVFLQRLADPLSRIFHLVRVSQRVG